jgi:glycosyltransferase involved in cell wall biosynthesis
MKIVFYTEMYSENMGYVENLLPKAVAKLGHEVHVIASTAQVYFNSPDYEKTYEPFLGPNIVEPVVKHIDGYTLYRLPLRHSVRRNIIRMKGLGPLLEKIHPDVIQTFEIYSIAIYDAALEAKRLHIRLFTENHIHASVFDQKDLKIKLRHWLMNFPRKLRFINQTTMKHYPIAEDAAKISVEYFKVPPEKIEIQSLGVDADMFTPVVTVQEKDERNRMRKELGLLPGDLVCIYTGRFTKDKNPGCLAQAISHLQGNGHQDIKAIFVGNGAPEEVNFIKTIKGCIVHPFVKVDKLAPFYRLADIGVWPRQESTSQLDAMACGLPVIVSDRVGVRERVEGNGLFYEENDYIDLADKILQLTDWSLREQLAERGMEKIRESFSWEAIAKKRTAEYKKSLP